MHGESPAESARRLVVQELQLAARSSEATRRARKRARESPPEVQQLVIRLAGIHRDSELRHLTAAHAHAENASRLRRQAGESDSTLARVYMSATAAPPARATPS